MQEKEGIEVGRTMSAGPKGNGSSKFYNKRSAVVNEGSNEQVFNDAKLSSENEVPRVMKRMNKNMKSKESMVNNSGQELSRNNPLRSQSFARKVKVKDVDQKNEISDEKFGFKSVSLSQRQILRKLKKNGVFPLKKKSTKFPKAQFFCRLCDYHCDSIEISKKHIGDERHMQLKNSKSFEQSLCNLPPPCCSQYEVITELLESVHESLGITDEEIEERKRIKDHLEKQLESIVPGVKLQINGSTLSGFALKSSDLDLDVNVPEGENIASGLLGLKKIVEKDNEAYTNIINNLSLSYPNLVFTHKKSNVTVVAGIPTIFAVNTNILLNHYCSYDKRVKIVVTALKQWAMLCEIDSQKHGTLPSYCFGILAIHFLQQVNPTVLPVLHEYRQNICDHKSYQTPDELNPPWKSVNKMSVGELWIKLLKFYALDFDVAKHVVNIRNSRPMVRTESKFFGKRLAIEDPFHSKRNMSHTVSTSSVFDCITNRFRITYKYFGIPQLIFGHLFQYILSSEGETQTDFVEEESEDEFHDVYESLPSDDDFPSKSIPSSTQKEVKEREDQSGSDQSTKSATVKSCLFQTCEVKDEDKALNLDIKSVDKPLGVVSLSMAVHLMSQLSKEMLLYRFEKANFTAGTNVPLHCTSCQKNGHTKVTCVEDELPPLKPLPVINERFFEILSSLFYQLTDECAPTLRELRHRELIVQDLQAFIRNHFPGTHLKLFGSSANGFGFGNSDLDICVTFDGFETGVNIDYAETINILANKFKYYRECRQVLSIPTAKVPIVKLSLWRVQLEADLSLYNILALQNTKLLWSYTKIDERVQVLGFAIKYFVKLCDIGDASRGSLSSYAYILILLHFLQQCNPPVIPVLQQMYDHSKPQPEIMIDGYNAWFFEDLSQLPKIWKHYRSNRRSVGVLWVEMLRYYTEVFDWKNYVINIRQLEPLTKLEKLWTTPCLAIEDPFDLTHNLGAGLSRNMNSYILTSFIKAREIFGSGPQTPPPRYPSLVSYLFDKHLFTDGRTLPNDRGCRLCGRIGHIVRDCPRKKPKKDNSNEEVKGNSPDERKKEHRVQSIPVLASPAKNIPAIKEKEEVEASMPPVVVPVQNSNVQPPGGKSSQGPFQDNNVGSTKSPSRKPHQKKDPMKKTTESTEDPVNRSSFRLSEHVSLKPLDAAASGVVSSVPELLTSAASPIKQDDAGTTEIKPSDLFNMANKMGGGTLILSSGSVTKRSSSDRVVPPPPGFNVSVNPVGAVATETSVNLTTQNVSSVTPGSSLPLNASLMNQSSNIPENTNITVMKSESMQDPNLMQRQINPPVMQMSAPLFLNQGFSTPQLQSQHIDNLQLQLQQMQLGPNVSNHLPLNQQVLHQSLNVNPSDPRPLMQLQQQQQLLLQQQQLFHVRAQVPQPRPSLPSQALDGTAFISHVMSRSSQPTHTSHSPPVMGRDWGPWKAPPEFLHNQKRSIPLSMQVSQQSMPGDTLQLIRSQQNHQAQSLVNMRPDGVHSERVGQAPIAPSRSPVFVPGTHSHSSPHNQINHHFASLFGGSQLSDQYVSEGSRVPGRFHSVVNNAQEVSEPALHLPSQPSPIRMVSKPDLREQSMMFTNLSQGGGQLTGDNPLCVDQPLRRMDHPYPGASFMPDPTMIQGQVVDRRNDCDTVSKQVQK